MATYDWLLEYEVRQNYPDAFALTAQEARLVVRADWIQVDVLQRYIGLEEEQLKSPTIQAEMRENIFLAFKEKRISPARIVKIAERVRQGLYWSYHIVHVVVPNQEQGIERVDTYEVDTNIAGVTKRFDTSLQAFFATDNPRERARLLGVPDAGLYVPTFELHSLQSLYHLCKEREITPQGKPDYWSIKSSLTLDALSEVASKSLIWELSELYNGYAYRTTTPNGVSVSIDASAYEDLEQLLHTPNADKLLIQFNHKAIEQGLTSKTVELTLDEVMEARGLRDRKEAAKAIKAAARLLYAVSINIEDVATGSFSMRRVAQEATYIAGKGRKPVATITYTDAYYKHLQTTQQFMQYPTKLQMIPNNKTNAYIFGKEFAKQKRRNAGKPDDIEDKLTVATLLRRSTLPTYTSLKDKGQASQLIIKPFIDAFDYLEEQQLFSYHFQYKKDGGKPVELTDADIDKLYTDYSLFYSLVVRVSWYNPPDYEHLIERKELQRERARKNKGKGKGRGRGSKPVKG